VACYRESFTFIQQQEKLRDEGTLRLGQQGTPQKRKREDKDPDVEEALLQSMDMEIIKFEDFVSSRVRKLHS
jgi:hypothetical protein